jgi:AraC family transcriptional activator of pyochelin receptor
MRNTRTKHPVFPSTGGAFRVIFEGKSQMPFRGTGRITYFCHALDADVDAPFMRSHEFLGLHFNLLNDFRYSIQGVSGMMKENQYNLVHIPKGLHEFAVPKGMYASMSIELTPEYLRVFADHFPILNDFLNNLQSSVPTAISKKHLSITQDIFPTINNILNNEFTGAQLNVYLDSKLMDIILFSLINITHADKLFDHPYTKSELEKIRQAREHILHGLQYNQSIGLLADKVGMTKRKLAAGFKLLYDKTIYDFLIDERLQKAMFLIRDTTTPLKKIALSIGYKTSANFSAAFKKRFGLAPSQVRKMNKGQAGDAKKNKKE